MHKKTGKKDLCVNHTVYVILIKMMCALKQYIIFVVVVVVTDAAAAAVWLAQCECGCNISATSCLFLFFFIQRDVFFIVFDHVHSTSLLSN